MGDKNLNEPARTGADAPRGGNKVPALARQAEGETIISFVSAFRLQLRRHNDTCASLARALPPAIATTLREWFAGRCIPRQRQSLVLLRSIEVHYALPEGYFARFIANENVSHLRRPCNLSPFQTSLLFEMNKHGDTSLSL